MAEEWFERWFNTPYYHTLYKQHNSNEAAHLLASLSAHLNLRKQARVLDVACGKGRHSIILNKKGFDVTGIDISPANITHAKQYENEKLHFHRHDMRKLLYTNYFDVAFNLFTSFGYFNTKREHIKTLQNLNKSLHANGLFVIDYFNTFKVLKTMHKSETKTIGGITFHIKKEFIDKKIVKLISFDVNGRQQCYMEKVSAFMVEDFQELFSKSHFRIIDIFGDYALSPYCQNKADRLLIICKKTVC
ncbi:methyltransferase domain-containing protein [Olivibacter sp. SDN3]|uniref:class I SAM-dependent methyltransferase n=1 Tax=Olivibacter sp. SDN3 TaxID=2764720 RepID=UPI0016518136|nr:class I SAM-dependent methyltransferase [Olivibacter sp. SDN3]QNL49516.1 methyltransferase domain-containing protein [Olivibacter sp. SDN3]